MLYLGVWHTKIRAMEFKIQFIPDEAQSARTLESKDAKRFKNLLDISMYPYLYYTLFHSRSRYLLVLL